MESQKILTKEKLGFYGIIKEVLSISTTNWKFIILSFLTCFPLFSSLLLFQLLFTQDVLETLLIIYPTDTQTIHDGGFTIRSITIYGPYSNGFPFIRRLFANVYHKFLFYGPLYMLSVHLLSLLNTIAIVHSSSAIYAGDQNISLNKMLNEPFTKVGFFRPLVTSIYVLLLNTVVVIGLLCFATNIYLSTSFVFCAFFFGLLFKALITKFIEWSAIWNTGVVISVLQEQHGYIPIGVAALISRGCRLRGSLLMLVFFMWRLVLRSYFVYLWWQNQGNGPFLVVISIITAFSLCLENVLKGVTFMVYFYDCKKRFMEKKIDLENDREVATKDVAIV
ncbi:hypothetical protein ACFE04_027249 [Oxalis oulophora]